MASKSVSATLPRVGGRLGLVVASAGLVVALIVGLLIGELVPLGGLRSASSAGTGQIEPQAGTWKTWVLASGSQLRPAPPPDAAASRAEIQQLQTLVAQRAAAGSQIAFWDTGSPAYRWNELAIDEALKHNLGANYATRAMALVDVAIDDATIATWDTKYAYHRPRPSELDPSLTTAVANPADPSYPAEHAATAGAASAVLAYLFPDDAKLFADKADEAGQSRLLAGVQYPSDVTAGLALGRAVAAPVIERAKSDGSDAQWTGSVPTEPGHWTGTNPVLPMAGTWKTWVLSSGSELRPPPPPAYNSEQEANDMAELRNVQRTPKIVSDAFFWEYGSGGTRNYWFWNLQTSERISASRLDANPPRAARAYALESVAIADAAVACWDAKYTYWAMRPFQVDPSFKPLIPTPNHPSYPEAHGCLSGAAAATLAYLFPPDSPALTALANQAAESRIWAGIHFRSDVTAGLALGRAVAQKVVQRAQQDGAP
jgi:membrane-associated phospholipid phosphatase